MSRCGFGSLRHLLRIATSGHLTSSQRTSNVGHAQSFLQCEANTTPVIWSFLQLVRHVRVNGSEVKIGNVIERKGKLHQVIKTQHTQQGRGGATIQVELRDVQSGLKSTERLRTSETVERVFVDEKSYTYLYSDGDSIVLMEPSTYEQLNLPKSVFGESVVYLSDGMSVTVQLFNGEPFSASVPSRVTCVVEEAEPYFKGQTVTSTYKKVTLANGQVVQVPGFVVKGDEIVIDTSQNSYVTRAKSS